MTHPTGDPGAGRFYWGFAGLMRSSEPSALKPRSCLKADLPLPGLERHAKSLTLKRQVGSAVCVYRRISARLWGFL
jgi:hypothetical protein